MLTSTFTSPDWNFNYNIPTFQEFTGTTPMDLLSLLQGYKSRNLAQQIAGQKELAGLGYQSAADLQKNQLAMEKLQEANRMRQFGDTLAFNRQQSTDAFLNPLIAAQQADLAKRRNAASKWASPYYTLSTSSFPRTAPTRLIPFLKSPS